MFCFILWLRLGCTCNFIILQLIRAYFKNSNNLISYLLDKTIFFGNFYLQVSQTFQSTELKLKSSLQLHPVSHVLLEYTELQSKIVLHYSSA